MNSAANTLYSSLHAGYVRLQSSFMTNLLQFGRYIASQFGPLAGYLLAVPTHYSFLVVVYGQVSKVSLTFGKRARLQKQSNVRHDATPVSTSLSSSSPSPSSSCTLSLPVAPLSSASLPLAAPASLKR